MPKPLKRNVSRSVASCNMTDMRQHHLTAPADALVPPHSWTWRSETRDDSNSPHQSLLSCAAIKSVTDWFIHSLMSSVQRLLGRPRVLLPLIRLFRMKLVTLRVRAMCPKYFNFRLCTSVRNRFGCSSSKIEAFVLCSLQLILNILLCAAVSNAVILRLSAALNVHVSQLYNPNQGAHYP